MLVHSNLLERIKLKRDDEEFMILEESVTPKEVIADIIFIILFLTPLLFILNGKSFKLCRYCNEIDDRSYILFYIILPAFALIIIYDLIKKRKITFDKKSKVISEENFPIKSSKIVEFYSIKNIKVEYRAQSKGQMGFMEFYAVLVLFGNTHIDIGYFYNHNDAEIYAQRISDYIGKSTTDGKQIKISTNARGQEREEKTIVKIIRIFFVGPQDKEEGNFAKKILIIYAIILLIIAFIVIVAL